MPDDGNNPRDRRRDVASAGAAANMLPPLAFSSIDTSQALSMEISFPLLRIKEKKFPDVSPDRYQMHSCKSSLSIGCCCWQGEAKKKANEINFEKLFKRKVFPAKSMMKEKEGEESLFFANGSSAREEGRGHINPSHFVNIRSFLPFPPSDFQMKNRRRTRKKRKEGGFWLRTTKFLTFPPFSFGKTKRKRKDICLFGFRSREGMKETA